MPYVRIEIPDPWPLGASEPLFDAIDAALVAALGVPPHDAFIRLCPYASATARLPARHGPLFTFIEVQLFPGRSEATKRCLYRELCERLQALGIPGADLVIALVEIARENWGLQGGRPASEIDPGFVVER